MKKGDIVVRIKNSHNRMTVGDVDKIKKYHSPTDIDLEEYRIGHDGENLRLATKEEKEQYYAKQGILRYSELNYQIY